MHYYIYRIGIDRRCETEYQTIILQAIDDKQAETKLDEYYTNVIRGKDKTVGIWRYTELVWTSDCMDEGFTLVTEVYPR